MENLKISGVRNLISTDLPRFETVNLVYGVNGSGKTTLLEAIYLLGTGRSFRINQVKTVIQHGATECTVFGRVSRGQSNALLGSHSLPLGIVRESSGACHIRVAGESVRTIAELAENLPLQVINSESFGLLEGGPKVRRQFLDWGVFHVKQGFNDAWKRLQRCVKQRNFLLRRGRIAAHEIAVWDQELCELAESIDHYRKETFDALVPLFDELVARLLPAVSGLSLRYYRGWPAEQNLDQLLKDNLDKDEGRGHTSYGPHRATIQVSVQGVAAHHILSRGQQKLVVCALKIAQGQMLKQQTEKHCVYLVDDLPAELDSVNLRAVCQELSALNCQLFVTGVDLPSLVSHWQQKHKIKTFHVEQGRITEHCSGFGKTGETPE